MTFTEAAVHVLRLVGKPLHYKEITDVAIEKDLLSHVGKSPEVTMGARLAAIVKKGGEDNPLSRVKPGVFALAEWDDSTIQAGLNDRTPALKRLAEQEAKAARSAAAEGSSEVASPPADEPSTVSFAAPPPLGGEDGAGMGQDEIARAELTAAATAMFAPEDDDDEPLLGGADDDDEDEDEDSSNKRRRRRRRRGRGGDKDEDDLPTYTVSEAPGAIDLEAEVRNARAERGERGDRERGERGERERGDRERGERERGERERGERERNERGERERGDRERDRDGERARPRIEEGSALELVELVDEALGGFRRQGGVAPKQLADLVAKRVRNQNDGQLASWIVAACRADNLRRESKGQRPRFRLGASGRIALWDWVIDRDQSRLENEARAAVEKYQELVRQRLKSRLADLPPRAFGEFAMLLLEALDFSGFKHIKRASSNGTELHLSALQRSLVGELPVAIVVRKDGRDIGREQVVELRGALHHYGQAAFGVIVTAGSVMSGARDEASAPGATPVQFVDGARLAKLCEQTGVGVVRQSLGVTLPDIELFDALRAN